MRRAEIGLKAYLSGFYETAVDNLRQGFSRTLRSRLLMKVSAFMIEK
jgi:hypothetical protein